MDTSAIYEWGSQHGQQILVNFAPDIGTNFDKSSRSSGFSDVHFDTTIGQLVILSHDPRGLICLQGPQSMAVGGRQGFAATSCTELL